MSDWKTITLGEKAKEITVGFVGPMATEYIEKGIPFLRSQNVIPFSIDYDGIKYISEEFHKKLKKSALAPGDVVIVRTGKPGASAVIPKSLPVVNCSDLVIVRCGDKLDPNFISYYINSITKSHVDVNLVGAVQQHFNVGAAKQILIPDIDIIHQCTIASVLTSLDDKIDLLHRQNTTVEAMAETLFRQWFVEEAKEDWKEVKIKDFDVIVTDFVANGSFASLKENVTLITDRADYALFIRNTDLKSGFVNKTFVDEHAYNFLSKTKLYGGEVIISSVGDVGSVFRCPKFNIPMTLGNNVVMLKSKYNNFFYLFFNSEYGQNLIYGITSGSVQEKFNKTTFRDLELRYPSVEYIEEFEETVKIYFDKIDLNKAQIRTLTTLRDTLLPKLMSGEVRVEM